ncbi:MAG: tRNA pseudouridine(55) synthase TruB [Clostridiales bacterium]|nr:tRNA pseudouridine(55) synthase TruB [Clostridiales bacterium]
MNGLINLYKPRGMSSAQAVGKVKRILGEKHVGHMGTLDPMAEGVLVIGVGKSARLFDYISGRMKTYIAKFEFGYETDTLDALGEVVNRTDDIPSVDAALGAVRSLVGEIDQIPPVYSAKHVDGKRAYALARDGKEVELKPSRVTIYDAQLICQPRMNEMVFEITCSSGTYIRAICRDVAKMCGSLATLTYLQRTRSGLFDIKDSITLDNLEELKEKALIAPQNALDMPRFSVDSKLYDELIHGRRIECETDGDSLIFCNDEFFGIGCSVNGVLKLKTYLKDGGI